MLRKRGRSYISAETRHGGHKVATRGRIREPKPEGSEAIDFQFPSDIPMDKDQTLYQLLAGFQGVRDGLPELVKNSKDQYARLGITDRSQRPIVVLVNTSTRSLGVLDFAGASREDFERWKVWSSPSASRSEMGGDVEGGHGNGGKAFMVRGSTETAFMESCSRGRRTRMGFNNADGRHRHYPGIAKEAGQAVDDVAESNPKSRLMAILHEFRLDYDSLPMEAGRAFEAGQAFTAVKLNGITDWENRRKKTVEDQASGIPGGLASHPQAALTLESCFVVAFVDGQMRGGDGIKPEYPAPMPGFEEAVKLVVPARLVDPDTGEEVSTGDGDEVSEWLELRTSSTHLRTREHKALNVIRVRNARNIVANLSVPDLVPQNEAAFIFGELRVPALKDQHLSGADRKGLADTALTRAVKQWASEQVQDLAQCIQRALAKSHKPEDRNKANDSLKALRDLMKKFLDPDPYGGDDPGLGKGRKGEGGKGDVPEWPTSELGQVVHQIVLEPRRSNIVLAAGTGVPIVIRCFELREGEDPRPVRNPDLVLKSETDIGLSLHADRVLRAQAAGTTRMWLEDTHGGVASEKVEVHVLTCSGADILGVERPLLKGERIALRVAFHTPDGQREDLLIDGSVDETDMGRFGRSGVFTAGRNEGPVTIRVRFGAKASDAATTSLRIGPDSMPPRRQGGQDGGDIPQILLCGTPAPGMDDLSPDQRTHTGGEYYPTIIEEPMFDGVVWINPDSKESSRVRQGRGGKKGSAGVATKTFTQFLALKCFDILKRLKVRREVGEGLITELQFTDHLADAELKCADFVDEAYALADELAAIRQEEKSGDT